MLQFMIISDVRFSVAIKKETVKAGKDFRDPSFFSMGKGRVTN